MPRHTEKRRKRQSRQRQRQRAGTRRQRGGQVLGTGVFACALSPPLGAAPAGFPNNTERVTKLFRHAGARDPVAAAALAAELAVAPALRALDPEQRRFVPLMAASPADAAMPLPADGPTAEDVAACTAGDGPLAAGAARPATLDDLSYAHMPMLTSPQAYADQRGYTGNPLQPGHLARIRESVAALHAAGIVHGDLHPGNIMLGADGRPRIVDFGAAQTGVPQDDEVAFEVDTRAVDRWFTVRSAAAATPRRPGTKSRAADMLRAAGPLDLDGNAEGGAGGPVKRARFNSPPGAAAVAPLALFSSLPQPSWTSTPR